MFIISSQSSTFEISCNLVVNYTSVKQILKNLMTILETKCANVAHFTKAKSDILRCEVIGFET